eukprot:scaffold481065_cov31-Prasinocladus_malaysianus.AAC.2
MPVVSSIRLVETAREQIWQRRHKSWYSFRIRFKRELQLLLCHLNRSFKLCTLCAVKPADVRSIARRRGQSQTLAMDAGHASETTAPDPQHPDCAPSTRSSDSDLQDRQHRN